MSDERAIRSLLDRYTKSIGAKDAAATLACYSSDIVAFDLAPPLEQRAEVLLDPDNIQEWFDTWDGPIGSESKDLTILVGGDLAYAFSLQHMTGQKRDGEKVDLWFRATATFQKLHGEWKITHIHNSVPFAMDGSERALLDLKP